MLCLACAWQHASVVIIAIILKMCRPHASHSCSSPRAHPLLSACRCFDLSRPKLILKSRLFSKTSRASPTDCALLAHASRSSYARCAQPRELYRHDMCPMAFQAFLFQIGHESSHINTFGIQHSRISFRSNTIQYKKGLVDKKWGIFIYVYIYIFFASVSLFFACHFCLLLSLHMMSLGGLAKFRTIVW